MVKLRLSPEKVSAFCSEDSVDTLEATDDDDIEALERLWLNGQDTALLDPQTSPASHKKIYNSQLSRLAAAQAARPTMPSFSENANKLRCTMYLIIHFVVTNLDNPAYGHKQASPLWIQIMGSTRKANDELFIQSCLSTIRPDWFEYMDCAPDWSDLTENFLSLREKQQEDGDPLYQDLPVVYFGFFALLHGAEDPKWYQTEVLQPTGGYSGEPESPMTATTTPWLNSAWKDVCSTLGLINTGRQRPLRRILGHCSSSSLERSSISLRTKPRHGGLPFMCPGLNGIDQFRYSVAWQ